MPGSGRAGNASSLPSEPPAACGQGPVVTSPPFLAVTECAAHVLAVSGLSKLSRAPQSASPGSGCAGQAGTRSASRTRPPAPTWAAGAQRPPRHRSTHLSHQGHSISSWPQLIFRRQSLYRRASDPGARCSTGRTRPGPRRRGRRVWPPGERRPHRSLAGLEAGDWGAAGTAGALAAEPTAPPISLSPLGTRGCWKPGADPSDLENNYGKTAAPHAGGPGRPSGRSPWRPARRPHAASRPLAVPTLPVQAHIPPRSWLAGAQPVFYKYLAGPTLWPRVLCTARGSSQPETLVLGGCEALSDTRRTCGQPRGGAGHGSLGVGWGAPRNHTLPLSRLGPGLRGRLCPRGPQGLRLTPPTPAPPTPASEASWDRGSGQPGEQEAFVSRARTAQECDLGLRDDPGAGEKHNTPGDQALAPVP